MPFGNVREMDAGQKKAVEDGGTETPSREGLCSFVSFKTFPLH